MTVQLSSPTHTCTPTPPSWPPCQPIPLSIQLWSLREELQGGRHPTVLAQLAQLGYRGVECGDLFSMTPSAFRGLVSDLGLEICGYHQSLPSPAEAGSLAERVHGLGLDAVVFAWTDPEEWRSLEALDTLARRIETSRIALARLGVALIYHNHDHEFHLLEGRLGLEHLLERVPQLQLEIDTYWAADFGAQDPATIVKRFAAQCPLMHIKDGPLVRGAPHQACGAGRMDLTAVIAAVDPAVTRSLVVELDVCGSDMWQAVVDSYQYLVGHGLASGRTSGSGHPGGDAC